MYIASDSANQRIDKFLSSYDSTLSRSFIQRLIDNGSVTVNGKFAKSSYKLKGGDEIKMEIPELEPSTVKPEPIPLDILYEDESVIVINKPAGMVVHPAAGYGSGTLVNALLYHCRNTLSGIGGIERPGIVHRLDKDTSGLLMAAKDDFTHNHLSKQLKDRTIVRKYLALVKGIIKEDSKKIEIPIGRHVTDRKKMSIKTKRGRIAITEFTVIERFDNYTLLEIRLKTGRTHQIRVHLSAIGHPVAGDRVYGGHKKQGHGSWVMGQEKNKLAPCPLPLALIIPRQMLHAAILGFIHPKTGKYLEFNAQLPDDMKDILIFIRRKN
ncbi:MAG: RluA family pseudouridine synthase [Nitrospinae bacterium]|nr:RluA family pseudouridine synthase [Nitrospinota bacterium]